MTATIHQFPTRRKNGPEDEPHLIIAEVTVAGAANDIHVYPVAYFQDYVVGKPGIEPIPEPIMRRIVLEWLLNLGVTK